MRTLFSTLSGAEARFKTTYLALGLTKCTSIERALPGMGSYFGKLLSSDLLSIGYEFAFICYVAMCFSKAVVAYFDRKTAQAES